MWGDVNSQDLGIVSSFIDTGVIVPMSDRIYPLEEIAEAHRYIEKGHAKGKVIVRIKA